MFFDLLFSGTLIASALICDCYSYKIPNSINLWSFVSMLFYKSLFAESSIVIQFSLVSVIVVFLLLYPIFMIGGIGAGDIKLLCNLSGFLGVFHGIRITVISFVLAAVFGCIKKILTGKIKFHEQTYIHFSYAVSAAYLLDILIYYFC